jgi:hypothetical protein
MLLEISDPICVSFLMLAGLVCFLLSYWLEWRQPTRPYNDIDMHQTSSNYRLNSHYRNMAKGTFIFDPYLVKLHRSTLIVCYSSSETCRESCWTIDPQKRYLVPSKETSSGVEIPCYGSWMDFGV